MLNKTKVEESQRQAKKNDEIVLNALQEASKQYDRYLELTSFPVVSSLVETPDLPVPSWDSPLTLVIKDSP